MKYEDFKIGERYYLGIFEVKVISKSDEYKIITTIDSDGSTGTWLNDDLEDFLPIKEELPGEGLLVSKVGSLAYKLSDNSGYGFPLGEQSDYFFGKGWGFSNVGHWHKATEQQKEKFVKMLKTECEKRSLFEDTKIEKHTDVTLPKGLLNKGVYATVFTVNRAWNKNGEIFNKGKFATPLKETTIMPQVGKQYTHKKGNTYTVLGFTNDSGDREDKDFPITVIYMDQEGRHWSRPLSRWQFIFVAKSQMAI